MRSITEIVRKNFKLLIRSKTSALIVILGPLLVIFLLGIAFDNSNLYALNIGVYSEEYGEVTNGFLQRLTSQEYKVQKFKNEEICIQQIKEGITHACIVFPPGLSIEKRELNNEVTFYVDHSKLNLIYIVIETLTNKVSLQSKELSLNLTNILLEQLEKTRVQVFNVKPLVSQLSKDTKDAADALNRVDAHYGALELKFSGSDIGTTQLKELLGLSGDTNDDLIRSGLAEIRDDVDAAKTAAEQAGATEAAFLLGGVKADITSLRNNISTIDIAAAASYVDKIESNIGLAQKMIDAAFSAREQARPDVKLMINNLASSKERIVQINTAFDNIDSYIGSIQVNKAEDIVSPINTKIKAISSDTTKLNFLFPSLMALVIMFMAIMLSTTLVMMEKHSPAYFRNFITPVRDVVFILGTYLTSLFIVIIQIAIILGISIAFFSATIQPVLGTLILLLLLITTVFTFIGMIVGYIFTSEETGTLAAISIASLFLLISDLIIPLESMPDVVRGIAGYNPFILAEVALKKVIIFQSEYALYAWELHLLILYTALLFTMLYAAQKVTKGSFFIDAGNRFKRVKARYEKQKQKNQKTMREKELHIGTFKTRMAKQVLKSQRSPRTSKRKHHVKHSRRNKR